MSQATEVVIIGGGVIGCAIAYFLRKRGIGVTVLERGEIGAQASSAAAGLLAPLGPLSGPGSLADLLLGSFALFPDLVTELEDANGIRVEYERTGALRTVRMRSVSPSCVSAWRNGSHWVCRCTGSAELKRASANRCWHPTSAAPSTRPRSLRSELRCL